MIDSVVKDYVAVVSSLKLPRSCDYDNPRNPTTIADNVEENVGDETGMGFGSFAEATATALVIGTFITLTGAWDALVFLIITSAL